MAQHIVVIDHGNGDHEYRGPFTSAAAADAFAEWATREIDPAQVVRLADPLFDLLNAPDHRPVLQWNEPVSVRCPSVTGHYGGGLIQCSGITGHGPEHSHRDTRDVVTLWRDQVPDSEVSSFTKDALAYAEANYSVGPGDVQDDPGLCGAEHLYWDDDDQRNVTAECGLETGHDGEHLDDIFMHTWSSDGKDPS